MANGGSGKPKPTFYVAVGLVVVALLGFAFWRCGSKKEEKQAGGGGGTGEIDMTKVREEAQGGYEAEKVDDLTAKEFKEIKAEPIEEVTGASTYKDLGAKRVVRMAINIWAGWAPIAYANQGAKKVWKDGNGKEFTLEIVLIDSPIEMADKVAAGDVHLGWATVDMLPLLTQRLKKDPRTMPRVFHQVDWSNGGDGIVVRSGINNIGDLRGKEIALAQNSPSHYFLLNMLLNNGIQPGEVKMRFYGDAFQAAQAFNSTSSIAAVVTWQPDLSKLSKAQGNKLLIDTTTANKLIGDVWWARADFARDQMPIIEALVRGFLDAEIALSDKDEAKKQAAMTEAGKYMDQIYGFKEGDSFNMLLDAHWTNYAENRDFFLNANNPANFERTYKTAAILYREAGIIPGFVAPESIADGSIIKKLESEEKYRSQQNTYDYKFTPVAGIEVNVEASVLTKRVYIQFCPNKTDPLHEERGVKCDPTADKTLEDIATLAAQYGRALIQIEGHTDSSKKGEPNLPPKFDEIVRKLSHDRALGVKERLVNKYKTLSPDQFAVTGYGWDVPADVNDPMNQEKNRRVEVKVIPVEAQ